jgi:hypothetical protein
MNRLSPAADKVEYSAHVGTNRLQEYPPRETTGTNVAVIRLSWTGLDLLVPASSHENSAN